MLDLSFSQRLAALPGRAHWIDGPAELRFGAARDRSHRIVAAFRALGLASGDRVAVATDSETEVAPLLIACLRMGLSLLPLSPDAAPAEVHAILERAAPALVIADEAALTGWALPPGPRTWALAAERRWFGKPAPHTLDAALRACVPATDVPDRLDADRDLLLLATSGSSGTPKLVRLTTQNLVAQAETFRRELGFDAQARVMNLSPLVHVDGITGLFAALWTGSTLVRPGAFTVARLPEILHALYRYRVTHALVVPTLLQLFLRLAEDLRAAFRTGDLRLVISTAAPLSDALWAEIEERTGIPVVNMFGLTETGNVLFTRSDDPAHRGTLGRPVDCSVRIVGEDGDELAGVAEGELELSGPSVSPGYLGDLRQSPWFPTGDLVARDAAGLYRLAGRKKNVIISGGRNVYPEEVDAALASHPDVLEAVTVGVPDEVWGERVESCLVVRGTPDLEAIARHAAARLSPYKHPRALHLRAELPRGQSGKPLRQAIRDALVREGAHVEPRSAERLDERVIAIAAEVFRTPASALSRKSAPGSPRSWDSLAHLQLVRLLEESFDIELVPAEITRIDSLGRAIDMTAAKLGRER